MLVRIVLPHPFPLPPHPPFHPPSTFPLLVIPHCPPCALPASLCTMQSLLHRLTASPSPSIFCVNARVTSLREPRCVWPPRHTIGMDHETLGPCQTELSATSVSYGLPFPCFSLKLDRRTPWICSRPSLWDVPVRPRRRPILISDV